MLQGEYDYYKITIIGQFLQIYVSQKRIPIRIF